MTGGRRRKEFKEKKNRMKRMEKRQASLFVKHYDALSFKHPLPIHFIDMEAGKSTH